MQNIVTLFQCLYLLMISPLPLLVSTDFPPRIFAYRKTFEWMLDTVNNTMLVSAHFVLLLIFLNFVGCLGGSVGYTSDSYFGSGHDLVVVRSSPALGSVLSELGILSFLLSLPSPAHALSK